MKYNGQAKTAAEWAEAYNIPYKKFHARIQRGWSVARSLEVE